MLRIVDLTQLHPQITGDVGDMLTVSLNVDENCVARISVPASASVSQVIGKVSGELAMPVTAKPPRRLC